MPHRFTAILALFLVTGCAMASGAVVRGAGPDDLLKLRQGPGVDQPILLGLPDGTRLTRNHCLNHKGKLWCHVSLTARPGVSGYVSADYLAVR